MMEFVKLSTLALEAPLIKRLVARWKLEGLGFYIRAALKICANDGWHTEAQLLALRQKPLRYSDVADLLRESGLFAPFGLHLWTLAEGVDNGLIGKGQNQGCLFSWDVILSAQKVSVLRAMFSGARASGACTSGACTSGACTSDACVAGEPCEDKEEEEKEKERETRAHARFEAFLTARCPHLLEFSEPMTVDECRQLIDAYDWQTVQDVLLDMENDSSLPGSNRSCFRTAQRWLEYRNR